MFLIGENGQGKTNLLEAVYLLCSGGSFRTRIDRELIQDGLPSAAVHGHFADADGVAGEVTPGSGVGVAIDRTDGKAMTLDGVRVRDRMRLVDHAPCIAFTHNDLEFVDGGPDRRRWYFNQTLAMLDPLFMAHHRRYRMALRARNTLLRAQEMDQVPLYDPQLVAAGTEIARQRANLVEQISGVIEELFVAVAGIDAVSLRYRPSWSLDADADQVMARLAEQRDHDRHMRTTTSGPHRDEFVLMLDRARFAVQASTGQRRLASLILRVAQGRFFQQRTGRLPLLLLDDVLLELDADKRVRFVEHLPLAAQMFFTFLPDEGFQRYARSDTVTYRVAAGGFLLERS